MKFVAPCIAVILLQLINLTVARWTWQTENGFKFNITRGRLSGSEILKHAKLYPAWFVNHEKRKDDDRLGPSTVPAEKVVTGVIVAVDDSDIGESKLEQSIRPSWQPIEGNSDGWVTMTTSPVTEPETEDSFLKCTSRQLECISKMPLPPLWSQFSLKSQATNKTKPDQKSKRALWQNSRRQLLPCKLINEFEYEKDHSGSCQCRCVSESDTRGS